MTAAQSESLRGVGLVEHTPLPWEVVEATEHHGPYIVSQFGNTIADLYCMSRPDLPSTINGGISHPISHMAEMADPNAAFIVRACNSHDALLEAVTAFVDRWNTGSRADTDYVAGLMLAALSSART